MLCAEHSAVNFGQGDCCCKLGYNPEHEDLMAIATTG
jgi:hypothetical protein